MPTQAPFRTDRALGTLKHPWTEHQVRKAKKAHRKKEPQCMLCGVMPTFFQRNNDVHHLVPVHVDPSRACDPRNLITFCRIHHWLVGHLKKWKDYNAKCGRMISDIQKAYYKNQWRVTDEIRATMKRGAA